RGMAPSAISPKIDESASVHLIKSQLSSLNSQANAQSQLSGCSVSTVNSVLTFINTVAFCRRCIPPRGVARRSNTLGILPPRALRCGRAPQRGSRVGDPGRLAALGATLYL